MSVSCPYCGAIAGYGRELSHRSNCPSLDWGSNVLAIIPFIPFPLDHTGWQCPRCCKVHAPHVLSCDCIKPPADECGTGYVNPGTGYTSPPRSWGRPN